MSASLLLTPGLLLILSGPALFFCRRRLSAAIILLLPPLALWQLWSLAIGSQQTATIAGFSLEILHVTASGRFFAGAFIVALWLGALFAQASANRCELASAFVYAGSAVSVTLCGDWISLFFFWELMAVFSTMVIWSANSSEAWRAGMRYLLIHLGGGVVLLTGIACLASAGLDLGLTTITGQSLGRWLILAGILINAGAAPFSFWVADAYPTASPSGMIFLAAFTTKTAVYVLIRCFAGEALLIPIGLYMAVYGILYALREDNIRKILAYSIVNQVGFMVTAVGIGSATAINGATAHALAHILYKTVLLMTAGHVMLSVGSQHGQRLGGLARKMPWVTGCALVAAAASMGVPLTSSFITKSLILQAAADSSLYIVWLILSACSAAVVFNTGVRFGWLVFFQSPTTVQHEQPTDVSGIPRLAMLGGATLCILIGVLPQPLYSLLPNSGEYYPYTLAHIVEQLQLLIPAVLLFFVSLPLLSSCRQQWLDWDWLLRRLLLKSWQNSVLRLFAFGNRNSDRLINALTRGFLFLFRHHGPRGILARSWPTGSIALWVALLLAGYVLLYSVQSYHLSIF